MDRNLWLNICDCSLSACKQAGKEIDGLRWSTTHLEWVLYYNSGYTLRFKHDWRTESYMQLTERLTQALLPPCPINYQGPGRFA